MDTNNPIGLASAQHQPNNNQLYNNKSSGQIVRPGEINDVLALIVISWAFVAVTLTCYGSLNPISFLIAGGLVTCVVILCSGTSVLIAFAFQKMRLWLSQNDFYS